MTYQSIKREHQIELMQDVINALNRDLKIMKTKLELKSDEIKLEILKIENTKNKLSVTTIDDNEKTKLTEIYNKKLNKLSYKLLKVHKKHQYDLYQVESNLIKANRTLAHIKQYLHRTYLANLTK